MSAPTELTGGEKLAIVSLAIVGLFGDAFLDALLAWDWHRLFVFAAVAFSGLMLTVCLCIVRIDDASQLSRTDYLARSDAERAAR